MFITICCPKQFTLWGGGAMVKDKFNVEVRISSPHSYNLGYLGYLGDLIKWPRFQNLVDHVAQGTWPSLNGLV